MTGVSAGVILGVLILSGCAASMPSPRADRATTAASDSAECRADARRIAASAVAGFPQGQPESRFPAPFIHWPSDYNRDTYGPTVDPSARFDAEHRAWVECMQRRGYTAEEAAAIDRGGP